MTKMKTIEKIWHNEKVIIDFIEILKTRSENITSMTTEFPDYFHAKKMLKTKEIYEEFIKFLNDGLEIISFIEKGQL